VGTKSKYRVTVNNLVREKDLPILPEALKKDFEDFCNSIFVEDPYDCFGLDHHTLKGDLRGYRALEIDYNGISYRLVYRIYEKPAPKRVLIISFAEHDPAYEKAKQRK
jgi:Txe/YoeB family toxin of Txe-Axe toxin-antitoxin module